MGQPAEARPPLKPPANMPGKDGPPGIIIRGQDGTEHVATFESIIDGLKAANGQLLEENAILKSILKSKGVYL